MLIDVLKFIHLLLTLSLLGATFFCLVLTGFQKTRHSSSQNALILRLNRFILWLAVFAVITGTLLIYPKHFTFHTPWIQAAYILVFIFGTIVSALVAFRKKQNNWLWSTAYIFLIILLIAVIHDAVSKMTFLF